MAVLKQILLAFWERYQYRAFRNTPEKPTPGLSIHPAEDQLITVD
jgi:hypothetical protein